MRKPIGFIAFYTAIAEQGECMAYVFNLRILVDDKKPESVERMLIAKLKNFVADVEVSYFSNTNSNLDDSIANGTYREGDAFKNWLVCVNVEGKRAYWSNQYGWTSYDLATRFDSTAVMPKFAKEKGGVFVLEMEGR